MQISFVGPADVTAKDGGAWVVAAAESAALLPAAIRLDKASGGALTRALKFSRFTGKAGQIPGSAGAVGHESLAPAPGGAGQGRNRWMKRGWRRVGAQIVGRLLTAGETAASIEIDAPKASKVKKGGSGGASGLRRPSEKLRFRQVSHP